MCILHIHPSNGDARGNNDYYYYSVYSDGKFSKDILIIKKHKSKKFFKILLFL